MGAAAATECDEDLSVAEELWRLGGVATRGQLVESRGRRAVDEALRTGQVVAIARGRYALAEVEQAAAAAHRLSGHLCLTSAALHHGWAVKEVPKRPQVAVPRGRKVSAAARRAADVRRVDLGPDDLGDGATSKDRTLLDCVRLLPFDEALAIADSALRSGYRPQRLAALVRDARGPGSVRARLVARQATREAANPFESVLRAIALGVPGLSVRPQVSLWKRSNPHAPEFIGRPDLVDERLRVVVEAESFEWHGERAQLRSDCRRYNTFVLDGWLVVRFAWEDVMHDQAYVRRVLEQVVAERTQQLCPACRAAS